MTATPQRQRGFSILELLIVVLVIVVLAAVAVPLVINWLQEYRLGMAAQQVADALQATKMQAVAKTRERELIFDVDGARLGQEGATLVSLPPGVRFDRGTTTTAPEPGVDADSAVTFPLLENGPANHRSAAFNGRGLPDCEPGKQYAVYVTNAAGTRAVTMTSAGNIRIYSWDGSSWR